MDIEIGRTVTLEFASGITVVGRLIHILREDEKNLLWTFEDCTVTDLKGQKLFEPEWGNFDMAVGQSITSVYAGLSRSRKYSTYPPKSSRPMYKKEYSPQDEKEFFLYDEIRHLRESGQMNQADFLKICEMAQKEFPQSWLIFLECWELAKSFPELEDMKGSLEQTLEELKCHSSEYARLIDLGMYSY